MQPTKLKQVRHSIRIKHDDTQTKPQTKGYKDYLYKRAGEHSWEQSRTGLITRHRWWNKNSWKTRTESKTQKIQWDYQNKTENTKTTDMTYDVITIVITMSVLFFFYTLNFPSIFKLLEPQTKKLSYCLQMWKVVRHESFKRPIKVLAKSPSVWRALFKQLLLHPELSWAETMSHSFSSWTARGWNG